ncbi:MAG: M23 family metallopeptidase [Hormoscilla sp. GUM202]|nr:M23 family metallopeptidase [Hormoscilla sp. GUM202]
MQANQLTDEDLIKVNQLLTIPPKRPTTSLGFASAESSTFNNAPGVWSKPVDSSRGGLGGSAPTTDCTHAPEHGQCIIDGLLSEHEEIRLIMQQKQATSGDNSRDNNEALWPARQLEQSQPAPSAGMEMTGENTNKPGAVAPILLAAYIWPPKGTLTSHYDVRWGTPNNFPVATAQLVMGEVPILSGAPEVVDFAGYVNLVDIPQKQANSGDNLRENEPEAVAVAPIRNDQLVSPPPDRDLREETPSFNGYIWPAKGTLTSGYGERWGRLHKGIDIAGPIGTLILSAGSGEVVFAGAGWNGGYGNLVEIRHPDHSLTRYAHNNRILVKEGEQVKQGQPIAEMGSTGYSTGPHLHFEVHPSGKGADNPISYLPPRK